MTTIQLKFITPLDAPLPAPPVGEVLTEAQWTTLFAIADTIVPAIKVSSTPSVHTLYVQASEYATTVDTIKQGIQAETNADLPQTYLRESASSIPAFRESLRRILGEYVREDARKGFRVILSALE